MNHVELVTPSAEYLESYRDACREMKESGNTYYNMDNPDTFDEWKNTLLAKYKNDSQGIGLPAGYVPATTFWLVDKAAGLFIGTGQVRHRLTPFLERFGGHIGYAIRPSCWNKGYGTRQLALLLKEAQKLGIAKALITCNDDNPGSYRVMEKNGGVYQDTIENTIDGNTFLTRRYWFDLTAPRE